MIKGPWTETNPLTALEHCNVAAVEAVGPVEINDQRKVALRGPSYITRSWRQPSPDALQPVHVRCADGGVDSSRRAQPDTTK